MPGKHRPARKAPPKPKPTTAERTRALREAFELGLQMGCTPAEAAEEMARRRAAAASKAARDRLRAIESRPLPRPNTTPRSPARDWWNL
ncbi:hypothetical protein [Novosphingobium rosa]|uniref:hypothetical protein n=1 Tax=Novosphingobium rosa TaxID=76978 RepID=UPI00082965CB|nr:hypothetical protein [Novosphingobium rosa]